MARQYQKAANVYAKTLLELAALRGQIDLVRGDFAAVLDVFAKNPALLRALTLPMLSGEKKALLVKPLADKASDLVKRLLRLLEIKNRLVLLPSIAETFIRLEEESRHIRRARVVSAVALSAEQLEKLAGKLASRLSGAGADATSKTYILHNDVDPSLIAGFRVEEDGFITDTSLRHKLDGLRQRLAAA
jgi:F-type H+-transporting ATPase subunit delta